VAISIKFRTQLDWQGDTDCSASDSAFSEGRTRAIEFTYKYLFVTARHAVTHTLTVSLVVQNVFLMNKQLH